MKENFLTRGFSVVGEEDFADVYVINTCTVTNLADRKSRQYIRRMKRLNENSLVAVTGCYVQVSPEEVSRIEGVDLIVGNDEKEHLFKYVEDRILKFNNDSEGSFCTGIWNPQDNTEEYFEGNKISEMDSRTRAYIKIQNGCNKFCSYCIIPYARGPIISRSCKEIVEEAENLIQKGYKELVLTGINTALYGMEPGYALDEEYADQVRDIKGIEIVVKLLDDIPGDFRIRMGSLEPNVIDKNIAKRLLKYQKLCHHMHLSLQSGSERILKSMNRHYSSKEFLEIVEVLRKEDKDYGLTTDVIVGFPGEDECDFNQSKDVVYKSSFLKTHVFPYSERKGTKAIEMKDKISPGVKKARSKELVEYSAKISHDFLSKTIGSERVVLFEEFNSKDKEVEGHADNYVKVYCRVKDQDQQGMINNFFKVEFLQVYKDGILGKVLRDPEKVEII
jgi:threonylcarbamoyladenosine tRNA methylthiotransferase MtaB